MLLWYPLERKSEIWIFYLDTLKTINDVVKRENSVGGFTEIILYHMEEDMPRYQCQEFWIWLNPRI